MSKKHKKHHKSDKLEKSASEEKPLKLVLKVGGGAGDTPESVVSSDHGSEKKHKHKKKKKKKSSDKEKDRDRHHHKHHHKDKGEQEVVEEPVKEVKEAPVPEETPVRKPETKEKETTEKEKVKEPKSDRPERSSRKRELEKEEKSELIQDQTATIQPPAKKTLFGIEEHDVMQQGRMQRQKDGKNVLQKSLSYLHNILQRKDVNAFFSYPVTDSIAPGYSSIIKIPMDFSTMKIKIDNGDYNSVAEYRKDLNLMCKNCMVYNQPETIFYKEAARIMGMGAKQLSREKLIQMRKNLPLMAGLTDEHLGLDLEETIDIETHDEVSSPGRNTPVRIDTPKPKSTTKFEAIMDDMSPEEILAQAQAAAREAAVELTLRKPNSKFGFLRRRQDGSTTFNILNPDNDGMVSEKERIVNLGKLTGKLTSGAGTLAGFREDKRNKATPVSYMSYGPFSSYAPTYDSSFATLSKEDSDVLISTYGDETGIQYAKSLKDFVADSGEFAVRIVDGLLNILTGNEHSKGSQILAEKRKEETEKRQKEKDEYESKYGEKPEGAETSDKDSPTIDIDSLKSLSEIGIDMSFLDDYEKPFHEMEANKTEEQKKIDERLQNSAKLLGDLQKTQHERLSQKLPPHLAMVPGPSEAERELANKVTKELTSLAKQVNPADVVSLKSIRRAMGVSVVPTESTASDAQTNAATERNAPPDASQSQSGLVSEAPMEDASPGEGGDLQRESPAPEAGEDDSSQDGMDTS